jgi:hypothetical protein
LVFFYLAPTIAMLVWMLLQLLLIGGVLAAMRLWLIIV